jgi:myosin heavy subunit
LSLCEDTCEDMVDMLVLNEPEILHNIRARYSLGNIYTRIGPTMIIMNPYKFINLLSAGFINNLSTQLSAAVYATQSSVGEFLHNNPAHIFTVAALAYKQMLQQNRDQAIVISGESGAGKTENAKLAMKMLTNLSNPAIEDAVKSPVEKQVLACNPLLEAFGNACTVRNDNSSRFGKFVKIYFLEEDTKIQGVKIENYLLEKSRVSTQTPGERNYHIFYMLLRGCGWD